MQTGLKLAQDKIKYFVVPAVADPDDRKYGTYALGQAEAKGDPGR